MVQLEQMLLAVAKKGVRDLSIKVSRRNRLQRSCV